MDWSTTAKWQRMNDRFHQLMRATPATERHLDAMREHIKRDSHKALWTHITPTRLWAWCEWLSEWTDAERATRCEMRLTRAMERRR